MVARRELPDRLGFMIKNSESGCLHAFANVDFSVWRYLTSATMVLFSKAAFKLGVQHSLSTVMLGLVKVATRNTRRMDTYWFLMP